MNVGFVKNIQYVKWYNVQIAIPMAIRNTRQIENAS